MKKIFFYSEPVNSVLELIGNTPMIEIKKTVSEGSASIFAKIEFFNPCGSIKDRICLSMIEKAERDGKIKPGDLVVFMGSGGGLAFATAVFFRELWQWPP